MPEKLPLQLLADECVYSATTDFLLSLGYDLITVQELGLAGAQDDDVSTSLPIHQFSGYHSTSKGVHQ